MRCHYEVLELPVRTTSQEDIKRQYRVLARKFHPDRNLEEAENYTEKFKEISTAYEVLSNIQSKKWYDDHREAILKGASNGIRGASNADNNEEEETSIFPKADMLWKYFSPSCYREMNDASDGFFQIYQEIFQRIYQYEVESENGLDLPNAPSFGTSITDSEYELNSFYNFWQNFVSILSFSWADKVNPSDAPCREVRRMVEKDNKKEREKERKLYIEQVRELATYVKRRDPRIQLMEENTKRRLEEETKRKTEAKALQIERRKQMRAQCVPDEAEIKRREEELGRAFLLGDECQEDEGDDDDVDDVCFDTENDDNDCDTSVPAIANAAIAGNKSKGNNNTVKKKTKKRSGRIGYASAKDEQDEMDELLNKKLSEMRMHKGAISSTTASALSKGNVKPSDISSSNSQTKSTTTTASNMKGTNITKDNDNDALNEFIVQIELTDANSNNDDDDEDSNLYKCILCEKAFKSKPQLLQHFNNRTHKKKELEAKRAESKKVAKAV